MIVADINHHGASEVAELCQKISKHPEFRAIAVTVDIVDEDSVESMVQTGIKEFGRIDYSIHSAGVGKQTSGGTKCSITEMRPDRKSVRRNDSECESRLVLQNAGNQRQRHNAVRPCRFEGYGRARTAPIRRSTRHSEFGQRLDRQSRVREFVLRCSRNAALYRL